MSGQDAGIIAKRVARGAAWLDKVHPGWERKIDLASLDLGHPCRCVMGQIGGTFVRSMKAHGAPTRWSWSSDHGFHAPLEVFDSLGRPDRSAAYFAELDEAWIALLKERFDSGTLSDVAERTSA